ncbi:type VI secretion system-associated FHA domain protein TagH [Pseudomonas sp. NPDC089401]|uniref:type VI secretion system-associated FHA domain protein TagH n=1 Tax=Pseudomonas sp. NPDC089401 TaxID=3364462 RepID=UPI0038079B11
MPVILRVTYYRGRSPAAELSCAIDDAGTLGRAPGNDLVLEDPGKYISRKHACIERRDDGYYLVDTGSNPSVLNERLIGHGHEALLRTGDVLVIGDYQIDIELPPATAAAPDPAGLGGLQTLAVFTPSSVGGLTPLPPAQPPIGEPPLERIDLLDLDRIIDPGQAPLLALPGAIPRQPDFAGAGFDHGSPERQPLPQSAQVPAGLDEAVLIPDGYDALADLVTPRGAPAARAGEVSAPAHCQVLGALLEGLGLAQLPTARGPEALARLVGEMLREATGATMRMLMERTLAKRESNVELTLIGALANNPLKFFPDTSSALSHMLGADSPAYLPGVQALRGAFDDLRVHEQAVAASQREALGAVVRCFDPSLIARGLPAVGLMERLRPVKRKARLWACYTKRYELVVGEGGEHLQRLVAKQFSSAYPLQVSRLRGMP